MVFGVGWVIATGGGGGGGGQRGGCHRHHSVSPSWRSLRSILWLSLIPRVYFHPPDPYGSAPVAFATVPRTRVSPRVCIISRIDAYPFPSIFSSVSLLSVCLSFLVRLFFRHLFSTFRVSSFFFLRFCSFGFSSSASSSQSFFSVRSETVVQQSVEECRHRRNMKGPEPRIWLIFGRIKGWARRRCFRA